jgi:hypothetical protein
MDEDTPHDEYRRPTWEEVRRRQIEFAERARRSDERWERRMASYKAAIEIVKQQEAQMARRRCSLF